MGLPASVLKQQEAADELLKAQEKPKEEDTTLDIAPELLESSDNDLPEEFKKDEPAKIIKEAPKYDDKEIRDIIQTNKGLLNRNKTLEINHGKLEKELADLKNEIMQMKQPAPEPKLNKFSEDERRVFEDEGLAPELIEILEKKTFAPQQETVPTDIAKRLETVEANTQQTSEDIFRSTLDQMCPGWQEKNNNDQFVAELQELAPYSSMTKQQILQDAYNNKDAFLVAQIFNEFKIDDGKATPRKNLADLAQPKSSAAPTPTAQPTDKWGPEKIKAFYNGVAADPLKYTPKEIAAIEKRYIQR